MEKDSNEQIQSVQFQLIEEELLQTMSATLQYSVVDRPTGG